MKSIFEASEKLGEYNEDIMLRFNIYISCLSKTNSFNSNTNTEMLFCPEKQFIDHIYYTILSKNMNFNESFLGLVYSSYTIIYRGNGRYAYMDDNHPIHTNPDYIWEPFTKITL